MEKLSTKLNEIGQEIKAITGKGEVNVLDENDKLLDNQDLAFLLKVSYRTLQRYRTSKPFLYADATFIKKETSIPNYKRVYFQSSET